MILATATPPVMAELIPAFVAGPTEASGSDLRALDQHVLVTSSRPAPWSERKATTTVRTTWLLPTQGNSPPSEPRGTVSSKILNCFTYSTGFR